MKESVDAIAKSSIIPGFRCISKFRTFPLLDDIESNGVGGSILSENNESLDSDVKLIEKDMKLVKDSLSTDLELKIKTKNDVTTHFETKYLAVGLSLYEVSFDLGERNASERSILLSGIEDKI